MQAGSPIGLLLALTYTDTGFDADVSSVQIVAPDITITAIRNVNIGVDTEVVQITSPEISITAIRNANISLEPTILSLSLPTPSRIGSLWNTIIKSSNPTWTPVSKSSTSWTGVNKSSDASWTHVTKSSNEN